MYAVRPLLLLAGACFAERLPTTREADDVEIAADVQPAGVLHLFADAPEERPVNRSLSEAEDAWLDDSATHRQREIEGSAALNPRSSARVHGARSAKQ